MQYLFAALLLLARVAHAGPAWPDTAVRAGAGDYVAAPSFVALAVAARLGTPPSPPTWTEAPQLDTALRDIFRAPTARGRQQAKDVSDVLFYGFIGAPIAMDMAIALTLHKDSDLAWQILWMDLTTLSVATATSVPVLSSVGRDRPLVPECDLDSSYSSLCDTPNAGRSFYSGHTSMAVAGAGMICVTHLSLDLLGGPWDALTCGVATVAGVGTGFLRIRSDVHWTSDVLVGVGIGAVLGVGMPLLRLHGARVQPAVSGQTVGLSTTF